MKNRWERGGERAGVVFPFSIENNIPQVHLTVKTDFELTGKHYPQMYFMFLSDRPRLSCLQWSFRCLFIGWLLCASGPRAERCEEVFLRGKGEGGDQRLPSESPSCCWQVPPLVEGCAAGTVGRADPPYSWHVSRWVCLYLFLAGRN